MLEVCIIVGLPSSGKTSFAKYYQSIRHNFIRISRDDLIRLFDYTYHPEMLGQYNDFYYHNINYALKEGYSVIVDDTNLTAAQRAVLISIANRFNANVVVYQMAVTPQQCLSYSDKTSHDVLEELVKAYEYPSLDEGIKSIKGVKWHPGSMVIGDELVDYIPEVFDIATLLPRLGQKPARHKPV